MIEIVLLLSFYSNLIFSYKCNLRKMSHFGWVIIGDFSNFSNFGGFKGENKALRIETAVKTVLNNKN